MPEAHDHSHEPVPVKTYLLIGTILLAGTAAAYVFADRLELGWMATVLLIFGIATFKVTLVAMYFMHLKFEKGWKYVLTILPLLMVLALIMALTPDIAALWGGAWARYG